MCAQLTDVVPPVVGCEDSTTAIQYGDFVGCGLAFTARAPSSCTVRVATAAREAEVVPSACLKGLLIMLLWVVSNESNACAGLGEDRAPEEGAAAPIGVVTGAQVRLPNAATMTLGLAGCIEVAAIANAAKVAWQVGEGMAALGAFDVAMALQRLEGLQIVATSVGVKRLGA
jgi:hypothetical protein